MADKTIMSIYPPVGFHFKVEFDGMGEMDAYFKEVTGIGSEFDVEPRKEGGENRFTYTFPVRAKYSNIICKRGMIVGSKLIDWCWAAIENLDVLPLTVNISLMNENHQPLQTISVINAWPKKWSITDLNAMEGAIVVESLELVYQYFRVIKT